MKDKLCSVLRFLIRFFKLVLLSMCGKKHTSEKTCNCKKNFDGESENATDKEIK